METEIKIPSVGESVQEAILAEWYKQDGDRVHKDEPLLVIETDKVTLEIVAEADGILKIMVSEGETVAIGAIVGIIDTAAASDTAESPPAEPEAKSPPAPSPESPAEEPKPAEPVVVSSTQQILSPSVRRVIAEKNLDVAKIIGTGPGGRITKSDILLYEESLVCDQLPLAAEERTPKAEPEQIIRKPMTPIRKRIAARLLESKQNTAMLTTFNEIDMSRAMEIRTQYKESFQKKHGVSLGFMSFFIKACVEALKEFPELNAFIEDSDIVYHNYCHIGVAIGAERGLVVPVIRHAENLSFAELEQAIVDYVAKIRENRLELADLERGTFTISNGGVYGSLLSTPILNIPQSGILGMHKIEKRPVVIDDQIVIRPMMYVAMSYDHRIVDGREAVTFLKRIKECVENPERIMMEV
ncbi:2-oxoglutarate dehydrogenase complex dihydrolipoyllysine-residue succinyltransferase [Desulfonema magnum]|uniref:Dihydrolipoyllysine-residue succinyltransferase component of 2-oxoglutarate dehydrogenase complex n=1 Tax=Desulfonema magnum TaxID=45655 RepID=A0A975BLA4_9BACT|nr:2-oxoglutarate dehydrogenase complex dihydrolipoyllysine-residue succinyltransferase [Desulfonema magnum]QTA87503.1 Dihydrolipoyllysine-residue succinyltransferase component of 2-oxoglutarate dehydrogenase complex [Desulfonema magnum]